MAELPKLTVYIEPEDIVNRVLDEEEYKGKTLREWTDSLTNPRTNADRIRTASEDRLIEWYCRHRDCGTCDYGHEVNCTLRDWLKSHPEVEE